MRKVDKKNQVSCKNINHQNETKNDEIDTPSIKYKCYYITDRKKEIFLPSWILKVAGN